MFNKELFNKICSVTCSEAELFEFNKNLNIKEFDLDNSFSKYYKLSSILTAISKFEKGEISVTYLGHWACAYNWIIMATYWNASQNTGNLSFKDFILYEISDVLDCMSFYDDDPENSYFTPASFKQAFSVLDQILNSFSKWEAVFTPEGEDYYNDDDVTFLAINKTDKVFVRFDFASYNYLENNVSEPQLTLSELEQKIKELKADGFTQLKYSPNTEED